MPDPNDLTGFEAQNPAGPESVPAQPNAAPEQQPQTGWQQPQQTQYGYQQPQYNAQPQTGWQPPQPRYNYQQPQQTGWQPPQPQYNAQQRQYNAQQPQYNAQQPRYGAPQPASAAASAAAQYNYAQPQYGYAQPQYGYGQPRSNPAPQGHTKAIGSMVMMIICLSFLLYPLISYIINNFDGAFSYGGTYTWLVLIAHLCLLTGTILMLVGAILGSRGHKLFGIGVLLCIPCAVVKRIYFTIMMIDYYEGFGVLLLVFGVMMFVGLILAGVGCLARRRGLKVTGGILALVGFILAGGLYMIYGMSNYGVDWIDLEEILYYFGGIFGLVSILPFPIRREK